MFKSLSQFVQRNIFKSPLSESTRQSLNMSSSTNSALEYASSCVIPTTFVGFPLVKTVPCNHDSAIFYFQLPETHMSLDLPVCACILVQGPEDAEGNPAIRPYTPISDNSTRGHFKLLVKRYDNGVVSKWLHSRQPGDVVQFKHIKFNVKMQYPFGKESITMVAGGSGITPMYQALHSLVHTPGDETKVRLLFGNKTEKDILLREELAELQAASGGRLEVVDVLSRQESWEGETGRIGEELIKKYAFPPSEDTLVFVCGVPQMYEQLCGPRTDKELSEGTVLQKLGYSAEQVVKF